MVFSWHRSRPRSTGLRSALRHGAVLGAWRTAGAGLALALTVWTADALADQVGPSAGSEPGAPAPAAPATVAARLTARHDCWTAEQKAPVERPRHVVVTPAGGRAVYSRRLTGPALEQIFADVDHDLTVHAFCR